MKKILYTLTVILTISSCSSSSSTSVTPSVDSTFNGSYIDLDYNSKHFHVKDVSFSGGHWVTITSQSVNGKKQILLPNNYKGVYGIETFLLTYDTLSHKIASPSSLTEYSPTTSFAMDTTGHVTIIHDGADYLLGSFSGNMISSSISYPVTGTFKVYH